MYRKIFYCVLCFLLIKSSVNAQEILEQSKIITISDGLAHNGVTSILEDSNGYLWFGTFDGLNKYNGYDLKTYKNTIDNTLLANNRVRSLIQDAKGNVWIGTEEGISIYNYNKEHFFKVQIPELTYAVASGPTIREMLYNEYDRVTLCATERNGVLIFNGDYEFQGQFYPKKINSYDKIIFFGGVALNRTDYLFTSSAGLFMFSLKDKKFKRILSFDYCNSITQIDESLYLLTLLKGAAIVGIDYQKGRAASFSLVKRIFEDNDLKTTLLDSLGNLWLGTSKSGVVKIEDFKKGLYNSNFEIKKYNNDLRTSCLISTSKNTCWVGTFNNGVYKFNIDKNPFKNYKALGESSEVSSSSSSSSSSYVNHIQPIDSTRFYVTSPLGGLSLFNTLKNKFEPIQLKPLKRLSQKISAIFIDSKKNIWVRIVGRPGLGKISKNGNYKEVFIDDTFKSPGFALTRAFTEDEFGNIWFCTNQDVYRILVGEDDKIKGVESLNNSKLFKNNKVTQIRYVYSDPLYNLVWVATDADGLLRIKNKKNVPLEELFFDQFTKNVSEELSIPSNFITSINRLPNNQLWVGTEGGGLCRVKESNSDKAKFLHFGEKEGLSNHVVKSILNELGNNVIWVSTNIGLNRIDLSDMSVRTFGVSDGLPFEDFWFEAKALKNGNMVLSGTNGFCYFNPKDIPQVEELPNIEFQNFKLYNQLIKPGDTIGGKVVLENRINNLDTISLNYDQNVFSLDVISLHYSNPDNHKLKYKLLPISNKWVEVPSSKSTIYYNGLQPGEYELKVMGSNSLNDWTVPKTLKIVIDPPFWKTTVAYCFYTFFIFLIIIVVRKNALRIQSLRHDVEIEQMALNNIKASNEAKLQFFSNISHEIKTPLTLISGPINNLYERFKKNEIITSELTMVKRQIKKVFQLIEQVQDFRKSEVNLLDMNYTHFKFNEFIEDLVNDFKFFAEADNKKLDLIAESQDIIVSADKDKLEKIFNNLLNNAFKFTNANDSVSLAFKASGKDLTVVVSDTGKGIDSVDLAHIFERFYQSHKKQKVHLSGSGIGLAFSKKLVEMHYGFIDITSEINKGTEVKVKLPVVKQQSVGGIKKTVELPEEKEVDIEVAFWDRKIPFNVSSSGDFSESLVYYAEDNPDMRMYVKELLSKFFKVESFNNGQACLSAMETQWPDLVISDIQMPELSGLDLCLKIKSDIKTSHIPVILLTALSNIENHLKGIRDGADAYIKKPFNAQQLITTTEALLQNRKQLRERYQIGIPLTKENKNSRNDNAFLDKLYSLIEENLDNKEFDSNSMAKELYLNRTHFFQKVKTLTNQTPFEILRNYRLKKAAELLAQKQLSVNETYLMTGFKSRSHFSKIFKEKYGVSPGQYADKIKDNIDL